MNSVALSRSIRDSRKAFVAIPLLYPALGTSRAASLNSAINHGIRRSKGVGFRGKERPRTHDAGQSNRGRNKSYRPSQDYVRSPAPQSQMRAEGRPSKFSAGYRHQSDQGGTLPRFPQKTYLSEGDKHAAEKPRRSDRSARSIASTPKFSDQRSFSRGSNKNHSAERSSEESRSRQRPSNVKEIYPSLFGRQSPSSRASYQEIGLPNEKPTREYGSRDRSHRLEEDERTERRSVSQEGPIKSENNGNSAGQCGKREMSIRSDDAGKASRNYESRKGSFRSGESPPRSKSTDKSGDDNSLSQFRIDSRMPISIPYTTPASEFLYGTSVVEAALRSKRVPRRKHYKLYIYNGNNREGFNVERDAGLERLAVKSGVEVVRVSGDWLRVMDKMSGGRPHNGYILEASPLPRRPVTSLGEFISTAEQSGFKISLDHQSREEAAVNGTDDFIKHSSNVPGRKPLVLLLDSIVDPGNLGGIIRTASFLGVSAIAVSTRNSASFTSVVLKASAGASECVTIFTVNKPAGFLVDSQAARWKIYAAVSPTGGKDPSVPESIDADELADPLSENPCILVLGGEGDGLRRNLRSKADVDVSIRGSGRMDSLNVSVAAGILCNSFLRTRVVKVASGILAEEAAVKGLHEPVRDLF